MSRTKRIFAAVGSGYAAQTANLISVGVSIPLALHYMGARQFGLWAVVTQVTGYLTLADLGFSQSVSRILIDHKDEMRAGTYGAILKAALIIFSLIACFIFACGLFGGQALAHLLRVEPQMVGDFKALLTITCGVLAISMLIQPFSLPLWSHQRSDLVNYTNIFTHFTTLTVLWITLHLGFSYYSLAITSLAGMMVYTSGTTFWALRLGLIPAPRYWGRLTAALFQNVAGLSRDFFILSIAGQLTSATQVIIVSNVLGLEAAGVWSVCTKAFSIGQQLISRFLDFSVPAFSEMFVRHEIDRLRYRLSHVISLSAVVAGGLAVLGASGNRHFIYVWTGGKVTWNFSSDLAGSAWLFLFCVSRCYSGMVGVTKRIGVYKYYALGEGLVVVLCCLFLAKPFGFAGVFMASLIANLLCNMGYGTLLVSREFHADWQEITWGWLHRSFAFIAVFGLCCAILFSFPNAARGGTFFVTVGLAVLTGLPLAWFIGLAPALRAEIKGVLLRTFGAYLVMMRGLVGG